MNKCISLFGTCGKSNWRDAFVEAYERLGIDYFNPVVEDWNPDVDGANEVKHSNEDSVLVFVITDEEPSYISLMEVAYKLAKICDGSPQDVLVYIDPNCDDKKSKEMRTMALKYLEDFSWAKFDSIEELFEHSVVMYITS